jgi:hypothetical protein
MRRSASSQDRGAALGRQTVARWRAPGENQPPRVATRCEARLRTNAMKKVIVPLIVTAISFALLWYYDGRRFAEQAALARALRTEGESVRATITTLRSERIGKPSSSNGHRGSYLCHLTAVGPVNGQNATFSLLEYNPCEPTHARGESVELVALRADPTRFMRRADLDARLVNGFKATDARERIEGPLLISAIVGLIAAALANKPAKR